MSQPPARPAIYHIVHLDRLSAIETAGELLCDAIIRSRSGTGTVVGMNSIKDRRLSLPVSCHSGTCVGDYVPFYFCSRSIMLYVIHMANHPELTYRGGQGPIVHLEADLHEAIAWANSNGRRWAFTTANAGAHYTPSFDTVGDLDKVDWQAVAATNWSHPDIKEAKQAEFLMHNSFPWSLVRRIGVRSQGAYSRVAAALKGAAHIPRIEIKPDWYY